jgi:hypothetical protein
VVRNKHSKPLHKLPALAPRHPKLESATWAPLLHYKMASHAPDEPNASHPNTPNVPNSIACRRVPSLTMAIDLINYHVEKVKSPQ